MNITCQTSQDELTRIQIAWYVGLMATILGAVYQIPQIWTSMKTSDFQGLNIWTYYINFTSGVLWIIYGVYLQSVILWVSPLPSLVCIIIIIVKYLIDKCKKKQKSSTGAHHGHHTVIQVGALTGIM